MTAGEPREPGERAVGQPSGANGDRLGPADGLGQLEQVKELLFGEERARLQALERDLAERRASAEEVALVLAPAVRRSLTAGEGLERSLAPAIEAGLDYSVRRNPKKLADAIYPALGPAIRRSIRQALAGMLQSMNQVVENTVSARGIAWRIEAFRTGRPFSEVALLRSLVYRVEQVLLIHRAEGVPLVEATSPLAAARDADLVSGMLTAIRRFAADSFAVDASAELEEVELGDLTLQIVDGPEALLAVALRGASPPDLRPELGALLERIHVDFAPEFAAFEGDCAPFEAARPELEDLLREERSSGERARAGLGPLPLAALLLGALALIAWGTRAAFRGAEARARFADLCESLEHEPGFVVVSAERDGDEFQIEGLRDPLARDPAEVARAAGVDPARLTALWHPFQSLDAPFVERRLRALLAPTEGVTIEVRADELWIRGTADPDWLARARELATTFGLSIQIGP
jgi:OOP family OmpA-OmpF porin